MKLNVYTDPGHGWVKVPKSLLKELGIANKITLYSYMRGDYAYLEEDCDASIFVEAMKKAGKPYEFKVYTTRDRASRIRNYARYVCEEETENA
jgi:hypothetical protein